MIALQAVPDSHFHVGDVLVVLNRSADVGAQEEIPHGDIVIKVQQDGKTLATTNISDGDGMFEYRLLWGQYEVMASFQDQDGVQWNCWGSIVLDKTQETLVVPCFPPQSLFVPSLNKNG